MSTAKTVYISHGIYVLLTHDGAWTHEVCGLAGVQRSRGWWLRRVQGRGSWNRHQRAWWRHQRETFSASLALCVGNSPITGEFPAQRPVTRSFDVFSDLRLIQQLSQQSRRWWFETPSRPLWRHCNGIVITVTSYEHHGVSNHRQPYRLRPTVWAGFCKDNIKVLALCEGIPAQRAINVESVTMSCWSSLE